jgi:hypothetical protein
MPPLLEIENDFLVGMSANNRGGHMLVCVSACFCVYFCACKSARTRVPVSDFTTQSQRLVQMIQGVGVISYTSKAGAKRVEAFRQSNLISSSAQNGTVKVTCLRRKTLVKLDQSFSKWW